MDFLHARRCATGDGIQRPAGQSTGTRTAAATFATTASTDNRFGQSTTAVMHANVVGDEGVVRKNGQVENILASVNRHAQDWAQVPNAIHKRVVVLHQPRVGEGVVLVQNPMVRGDAQGAAPIANAKHLLVRVMMDLLDF